MAHIYRIFNVITEQFYIGSALKVKRRRWEHWDSLKKNKHHCVGLQTAWNQYGEDAFEFEIIEEIPDDEALRIEDAYLVQFAGQDRCYNTALTTMYPPSVSVETGAKISATLRRLYSNNPKAHPRLGKMHSEETKAKISDAKKANPTKYWEGKERSEETKAKISQAQKGVPKAPRVYSPEGLEKAREVMRRNAKEQAPADFGAVKAKFPPEVLAKYDFSEAVYTGALNRIEGCKCARHGVFSQYAAQFRKGRGCPQCGAELRSESKRKQMKESWATDEGRAMFMESRKKPVDPFTPSC